MQFLLHNGLDSIVHQKIFITYFSLRSVVFAENRSATKTEKKTISILCKQIFWNLIVHTLYYLLREQDHLTISNVDLDVQCNVNQNIWNS